MKQILIFSFLTLVFALSCTKNEQPAETENTETTVKSTSIESKQNIVPIQFSEKYILLWDKEKQAFVKNENYNNYLKSNEILKEIAKSISNDKVLDFKFECIREANLKIGDLAFLYLMENHKIYLFKCLERQFDVMDSDCKIPVGLFDYVDKNRNLVSEKVEKCL